MLNAFTEFPLFDSHLHIIDKRFPLVINQDYTPDEFSADDYLKRLASYNLSGGAIVSGSFQAFDQSYLINALKVLGDSFVGVTQLPFTVVDEEIMRLHKAGVRALRFNLHRGGSEELRHLSSMAQRVYELVGWHVELYVDSNDLNDLYGVLVKLPVVSIDHLGLSRSGLKTLIKLVEQGTYVKATGFGRVDFVVEEILKVLYTANPRALMFGTDLPSTRAPRPYSDEDFLRIVDVLNPEAAHDVLSNNALKLYKPKN